MTRGSWTTALVFIAVLAALGSGACGRTDAGPTAPGGGSTGDSDILALDVSCPATLLIGQKGPCLAVARLRTGPVPAFEAAWSSANPDVVAIDGVGVVNGRSAGSAVISASYRGRNANASVLVIEEDAVRVTAGAEQGDFRAGTTVTMWLQGYYSVASAQGGRLSLRIIDQVRTIATTQPMAVAKGGDFFLLSSTFVVPQDATQVCRMAILEVGSVVIAEPQSNDSGLRCLAIRP